MPVSPRPFLLLLISGLGLADAAWGQGAKQEYIIRQEAEQGMLVRINGFEAEYRALLAEYGGDELAVSAVPGERIAPLFQYLPPVDQARDLVLRIAASATTSRSRFNIENSRITVRDERSGQLAQAYRLLDQGLAEETATAPAAWAVKVYALDGAADLFEGFGMEELRSWSRFHAAYMVLHRIGDPNSALDRAEALLADAQSPRQRPVRLAALKLRASALPPAEARQSAWQEVVAQAKALDFDYEQAAALFAMGRDQHVGGASAAALALYREALEIADRIGAGDLGTAVREQMVPILGAQGDASGTGEVLGQIESELTRSGSSDELAQNLLAQGRLANRTYRPERAVAPLLQALELEHNSLTRSQLHLELAQAWFAQGRLDEALAQARSAVVTPGSGELRRPTQLLDAAAGIDLVAAVYRLRGERDELRRLREAQARVLGTDAQGAAFLFQLGLDAQDSAEAGRRFAAAAAAPGAASTKALARIWACALGEGGACSMEALQTTYQGLLDSGVPARVMEARLAWARLQQRLGNPGGARRTLDELLDQALFLRAAVPGLLDAWLMQRLDALGRQYLVPLLADGDALASLHGLSKLRQLDGAVGDASVAPAEDNFRELLARAAAPGSDDDPAALAGQVNRWLENGLGQFRQARPWLAPQGLRDWLARLQDDQALITWHVDGERAHLWRADARQVRVVELQGRGLQGLLHQAREQWPVLEDAGFDALAAQLGERLLGPLAQGLPEQLLLVPAGPLLGLPLGALRLDGRYLAERAELVQLLDFPAAPPPQSMAGPASSVFLAGAPVDFSPDYLQALDMPAPLRAVINAFVGPGLNVVQGAALLLDEFGDARYGGAQVVHLALPGRIDLARPQGSTLELSEAGRGQGRQQLDAAAIAAQPLSAALVFLAETAMPAMPPRPTSMRLPLVADLLAAGASQVVATAWAPSPDSGAALQAAFYGHYQSGMSAPAALRAARVELLVSGADRDWAAAQLYTR